MQLAVFKYSSVVAQKLDTKTGIVTVAGDNRLRLNDNDNSGRQRFLKVNGPSLGPMQLVPLVYNNSRVVDAGGGLNIHAPLQIYPSHGGPNQRWILEQHGVSQPGFDGYKLWRIKAAETDLSWDLPYSDVSPGNWIQLYPWHGQDNQLWREEEKLIDTVVIKSLHNQRVLDVPGFAHYWTPIQHFSDNGGFNQAWELESNPGGPQKIRSVSSGRYLASTNVHSQNFSVIFQAEGANSDFQRWTLDLDSGGKGTIQNVQTGVFLSVATGPGTHGAELRGLPNDGSAQQQWQIIS